MADFFLSHATGDRRVADLLCAAIEADGMSGWMAARDAQAAGGHDWTELIATNIQASRAFVLILSGSAHDSRYVRSEVAIAFEQNKPIVAVSLGATRPVGGFELHLKLSQHIDTALVPTAADIQRIVRAVRQFVPRARFHVEPAVPAVRLARPTPEPTSTIVEPPVQAQPRQHEVAQPAPANFRISEEMVLGLHAIVGLAGVLVGGSLIYQNIPFTGDSVPRIPSESHWVNWASVRSLLMGLAFFAGGVWSFVRAYRRA